VNHGEYGFVVLHPRGARALAGFNLSREAFEARYCDEVPGGLSFKSVNDACTFLRDGKCSVYEFRPAQCRTFPFWPELVGDKDTWDRDVASFCPGAGQGPLHGVDEIRAAARRSGL
jgi:Fe-S-cluster containining protein